MKNVLCVVVSGASSGLGFALARYYLENGATVAAIARRGELLQTLSEQFPGKVYCYPLDVRDSSAIKQAATDFMSQAGVPDIVIANAGVSTGTLTEDEEDIDAFQQVMNINVIGMVNTFRPFISTLRATQRATLVGITSVAGFRGLPGASAYSASKAAAITYLESLRLELHGSGVKVVTICPGYIKTPMTATNSYPMPFILDADDAARRIALVIERQASFAVIPWQMRGIGYILKHLPNWLYDRLFANAPRKPRMKI